MGDALVERFCDLLAVTGGLQVVLVRGTAHKRYLGKNGGHGRAGQHDKGRVLDATVANARAIRGQGGVKRMLDARRKTLRFLDFFVQRVG